MIIMIIIGRKTAGISPLLGGGFPKEGGGARRANNNNNKQLSKQNKILNSFVLGRVVECI